MKLAVILFSSNFQFKLRVLSAAVNCNHKDTLPGEAGASAPSSLSNHVDTPNLTDDLEEHSLNSLNLNSSQHSQSNTQHRTEPSTRRQLPQSGSQSGNKHSKPTNKKS